MHGGDGEAEVERGGAVGIAHEGEEDTLVEEVLFDGAHG